MPNEPHNPKRQAAETETVNDLAKSPEHLLTDIHDESLDRDRPPHETISRTMARFAALLVVLSKKADEQFAQNLEVQKQLLSFTRATWILALAGILLASIQVWKLFAGN